MERKITRIIKKLLNINVFLFIIGLVLVILTDFIDLSFYENFFSFLLYNFEKIFFEEIKMENNKIQINNINFLVNIECTNLKIFIFLLPFFLYHKKYKFAIFFFFLTFILSFSRIVFEIFLFLNFNLNLDNFLSFFQNIFLLAIITFIVLFLNYYRSFKLGNKRVFNFF